MNHYRYPKTLVMLWAENAGGLPLIEMNRILRPGGFFVWSATPVYRHDERHRNVWEGMLASAPSLSLSST